MPLHNLLRHEINLFFLQRLCRIEENDRMERERREQAKQQQKLQMQQMQRISQSDSDAPQQPLFGVPKKVSKSFRLKVGQSSDRMRWRQSLKARSWARLHFNHHNRRCLSMKPIKQHFSSTNWLYPLPFIHSICSRAHNNGSESFGGRR